MLNRRSVLLGSAGLGVGALGLTAATLPAQAAISTSATSNFPVVKYGQKSGNVKLIQARVKTGIDGEFGPKTLSAVKSFQRSKGLSADGVVGPKTWGKLLSVVRYGSSGLVVKGLQVKLGLTRDGKFGPATLKAVKAYQKKHSLAQDGVVGAKTWGALVGASSGGGGGGGGRGKHPKGVYTNGRLPSSALASVGYGSWKLSTYCVDDYKKMNAAFKKHFGWNLEITGSMSAYRTYDQQVYLWNLYQSGKGNLAARPGTSNHGWGLAVDVRVAPYGSSEYNWLNKYAPNYGFNDGVRGEPWHWEYTR